MPLPMPVVVVMGSPGAGCESSMRARACDWP